MHTTCNHPTCHGACRRPKKQKKIYQLKRSPIKAKPKKGGVLSHAELLQLAQFTFNKWIRNRDKNKPCISGGDNDLPHPDMQVKYEAGHYYPAGVFSGVRFDEINVNGQSKGDNCFFGR